MNDFVIDVRITVIWSAVSIKQTTIQRISDYLRSATNESINLDRHFLHQTSILSSPCAIFRQRRFVERSRCKFGRQTLRLSANNLNSTLQIFTCWYPRSPVARLAFGPFPARIGRPSRARFSVPGPAGVHRFFPAAGATEKHLEMPARFLEVWSDSVRGIMQQSCWPETLLLRSRGSGNRWKVIIIIHSRGSNFAEGPAHGCARKCPFRPELASGCVESDEPGYLSKGNRFIPRMIKSNEDNYVPLKSFLRGAIARLR